MVIKSLEVASEWQINFYRCASLALFVSLVILFRYRRSTVFVMRAGGRKALLAGALLSGAMICNVVALRYTTVAVAVFVMAAAPVLAPLWVFLVLGEAPAWTTLLGGVILFAALGLQISVKRSA